MNRVYKSVWCAKTGTYVAASEHTRARCKSARSRVLAFAAMVFGSFGLGEAASAGAYVGYEYGGKDYCAKDGGTSFAAGCSLWGTGVTSFTGSNIAYMSGDASGNTGGVWASDNNAGLWYGNGGPAAGNRLYLNATGTFIESPSITLKSTSGVNLSWGKIFNLADGTVSATSADAINGSQLYNATRYFKAGGAGDGSDDAAAGNRGIAIGSKANAATNSNATAASIAIGANAYAISNGSGRTAVTRPDGSDVLDSIAMGNDSKARGSGAVALGVGADAEFTNIAIGAYAKSTGYGRNSIVIGHGATTESSESVVLGTLASASADNSIALGARSLANRANTVSVGNVGTERQIVNLAAGQIGTDAVNLNQLNAVDAKANLQGTNTASALGGGAAYTSSTGAVSAPSYVLANANSIAGTSGAAADVGSGFAKVDSALGKLNTSITNMSNGGGIKFFHVNSAKGDSTAAGANSIAIGPAASVDAKAGAGIAIGDGAQVTDKATSDGIAMGAGAKSDGQYAMALGQNSTATGTTSMALGASAKTSADNSIAIGANSSVTAANSVALGKGSVADRANSVAVGNRQITNLAKGTADTDAVNVAQLKGTTGLLGGGAAVAADGSVTAPSYALGNANSIAGTTGAAADVGTGFGKVDAALGKLNTSVTQNTADIAGNTTSITNLDGRVTTVEGDISTINTAIGNLDGVLADAVMYDSAAHDKVSFGAAGTPVQLTNVKAGDLSADSLDAVNGSQLFSTNEQVAQNTADIAGNSESISNIDGRVTTVEGDVTNLDNRVTTVEGDISTITTNINAGTIGLVQQSAAGENLTVGKDTDGAAVDFAGTAGARKLINVADGALAADSKEAVNGSQLFATNEQVAQNTADIAGNTTSISNLENNVTSIDNRVTNIEGDISTITTNINSGTIGLVQQSAAGENLTVGKDTDGAAVDFAGTAGARKLINVAAGSVAADSLEAVNGSQLFGVSQSVADALGGNSVVNEDGSVSAPSYTVTNVDGSTSTINNVGDAITNIDNRTTQNSTDISTINTNISNMGGLLSDAVMYDSAAHDKVSFGAADAPVQLTNVRAGDLSADSLDAVNGSQLFATNEQVAQNTADIAGNTESINNIDGRVTTVEGDVTNLDNRVTTVEGDISSITTNINSGTIGLVQQSAAGENLTVGKDTDGAAVDFAGTAGARKLINVAAGSVAADSLEAVNGSQLFATNEQVAQNTADIAGNSTSITNLDGRVTTVEGDISTINTNISNMGGLLSDAVMYDSAAHDKVSFGAADAPVQLTNVKAGVLSADSLDAVNGSQLFSTNEQVAQNTADIAGNSTSITNLDGRVSNVEGDITNITNNINSGSIGLVQQSAAGENLTVGKGTDGLAVDFAGTAGARKLINVADGTVAANSKDAVNGGQLFGVSQSVADALGGNSVVNADGSVSAPSYSVTNVDGSTSTINNVGDAISNLDSRTAQNTTDINALNTSLDSMSGLMSDAVMYDSVAHDKVTLGAPGKAVQLTNVKAGELSAESTDAVNGAQLFDTNNKVAIIDGRVTTLETSVMDITNGGGTKYFKATSVKVASIASGSNSIAMGGAAVASGEGSIALGDGAQASAQGSVALGQGASDNGRGAESYTGKYSGEQNDSVGTVAVGNATTGETRTISAVADAKQATDAVNLRQLDGAVSESKTYTDNKVTEITNNLGDSVNRVDELVGEVKGDLAGLKEGTEGMAQVNNTSRLPKPKATGNDSGAFGPGAESSGDNSLAMGSNAKARGKNSVAIGANSVAERDNSVSVGSEGNERQVTHVAAGTERTDAANVGQVQDALEALAGASDSRYNSLKKDLAKQESDLSAGIAGAIAIASLSQPIINGGSTTAVGVGTFNGQSALSVGVSHMSNDGKWTTKLGGSTDTQGQFSAGASVGYNW